MKLIADIKDIFGTITPPSPLAGYVSGNQTGAAGISKFISNGIVLIYSIAAVVLVLMLLWGAFEWLVSGGDKEAVAKARTRIINAFIGIILFAVTFAILALLGQFTGFKFFNKGQCVQLPPNNSQGLKFKCPNGDYIGGSNVGDSCEVACKGKE